MSASRNTPLFPHPRLWLFLAALMLAQIIGGCALQPPADDRQQRVAKARMATLQKYSALAASQQAEGDLAAALESWRIAQAVAPNEQTVVQHISTVKAEIHARVSEFRQSATRAAEQGNTGEAVTLLLRALALRPADSELRRSLSARYRTMAMAQIASTAQAASTPVAANPVAKAMATLARSASDANSAFEQGLAELDSDPDSARAHFSRALELDPTHLGARAYLDALAGSQ